MVTVAPMTQSQKLALRLSEIRQKLNELSALDEPTDEQRAEMAKLTTEYPLVEERSRAALVVEAADADARQSGAENAAGRETGEGAEVRRLQGRARLGNYLTAAASGAPLTGAESELLDALALRGGVGVQPGAVQVPWSMLLADEPAPEQRAATTTGDYGGPVMQRPILQRLFGPSLFDMLGVRLDTVPMGRSEWPLISAGVAPAQTAEDADAPAAVAWTVGPQTLRPKRLTGRYEFTAEAAVSVIDLEQALRRDLADAVMSQASDQLLNGNYDATARPQQVTGFYARLAAPTAPTAQNPCLPTTRALRRRALTDSMPAWRDEVSRATRHGRLPVTRRAFSRPGAVRLESRRSSAAAVPAWRASTFPMRTALRRTFPTRTSSTRAGRTAAPCGGIASRQCGRP